MFGLLRIYRVGYLPLGMQFALDSELSYFTRGVIDTTLQTPSVTGARLYLQPQLSLPRRR